MSVFSAKLKELRHQQALLRKEAIALVAKEMAMKDGEEMPESEAARLAEIEGQLSALTARIERVETALQMEGDSAQDVGSDDSEAAAGVPVVKAGGATGHTLMTPHGYGEFQIPEQKGFKIARFAIGIFHAKGGLGMNGAAAFIERRFGDKDVAKALNSSGVATGGALVPQAFATEFIELLRAETVIRKAGPVVLPMPLGNMTIPRMSGGATAGYQGELDDIVASQETFDDLQLNAKKLTALVPVSNDLIRRAAIGVEGIVRDDLVQTVARREDLAFQLGDGSAGSPIGFLNLVPTSNKLTVAAFTATDNATILTAVVGTLLGMKMTLRMNMSRMIRPVWIGSPLTEAFLSGLRDQVGNFVYKDELDAGTLMKYPFMVTQQLPTNVNTGTTQSPVNNGTFLFLVDMNDVILAETYNVVIDASDVASYKDAGGNSVSAFTRDQTAFRVIEEHDFNMRHLASLCVASLPGWVPAGYTNLSGGTAYYVQAPSGDASAAPSTWGTAAPTGSNNPANVSAVAPGGTLPGRP
jgi:HK97 family phage major capsid protein